MIVYYPVEQEENGNPPRVIEKDGEAFLILSDSEDLLRAWLTAEGLTGDIVQAGLGEYLSKAAPAFLADGITSLRGILTSRPDMVSVDFRILEVPIEDDDPETWFPLWNGVIQNICQWFAVTDMEPYLVIADIALMLQELYERMEEEGEGMPGTYPGDDGEDSDFAMPSPTLPKKTYKH